MLAPAFPPPRLSLAGYSNIPQRLCAETLYAYPYEGHPDPPLPVSFVSIKARMLEGLLPLQHYFSIAVVIAIISRIMAVIWRRMSIM